MASFNIHLDSVEKENPHRITRSKKAVNGGGGGGVGQMKKPLATIGGNGNVTGGAPAPKGANAPQKRKVLGAAKSNQNQANGAAAPTADTKPLVVAAYQATEIGNQTKYAKGTAATAAVTVKSNAAVAVAVAVQKTASSVVLEQFKSFGVYEDDNAANETTKTAEADKENACIYGKRGANNAVTTIAAAAATQSNDSPMSVICGEEEPVVNASEIISPMSVDQTMSSEKSAVVIDESASSSSSSSSTSMNADEDAPLNKEANENKPAANAEIAAWAIAPSRALKTLMSRERERFFDVPEYIDDIMEYLLESEHKNRPKPRYMRRQTDISPIMRVILIDWLVEVSQEYNLDTETLYQAVSFVDRFLSSMSVVRAKLQLVGVACIFIAAKYEEVFAPGVNEFAYITDDTYTKMQILRMEQIILRVLVFDLCTPSPLTFLNLIAKKCKLQEQLTYLAQYIAELTILEAEPYLSFLKSEVAAAAIALARVTLMMDIWSPELECITKYELRRLKPIILELSRSHVAALTLQQQAIQEKYKSDRYRQVSLIEPLEIDSAWFDDLEAGYYADLELGFLPGTAPQFNKQTDELQNIIKSSGLINN